MEEMFNVWDKKNKKKNNDQQLQQQQQKNNNKGNLFLKIWRFKYLRNLILYYIRYMNQKYYMKKEFKKLKLFRESKEKYNYNSILIDGTFDQDESLLVFLKKLPSNIDSLELRNIGKIIELKELVIPDTLKSLILNNTVLKGYSNGYYNSIVGTSGNEDSSMSSIPSTSSSSSSSSTTFNLIKLFKRSISSSSISISSPFINLTSFDLGYCNERILVDQLIPPTLKKLVIRHQITRPIIKGMLPDQLETLVLYSEYPYQSIYLPKNLSEFEVPIISLGTSFIDSTILDHIPPNIKKLKLYRSLRGQIKNFNDQLIRNCKKLVFSYDFNDDDIVEPYYLNRIIQNLNNNSIINGSGGVIGNLTSLDLSSNSYIWCPKFNIDLLPSSIIKIKLPIYIVLESSTTGRGFPSSLTSLTGSTLHLYSKFESSLSILNLNISFINKPGNNRTYQEKQEEEEFSIFNKFPNLVSLRFKYFEKPFHIFLKSVSTTSPFNFQNLELSSIFKHHNFNDENTFPLINSNIKYLKLDENYTTYLMKQSTSNDNDNGDNGYCSFLPSTLLLLDLNFRISQYSDLFKISKKTLPPQIKHLIIRNINRPSIAEPLPTSLEHIWIQSNNSILKEPFFVKRFSHLIRVFNSNDGFTDKLNSKIYKNLKNHIEEYK